MAEKLYPPIHPGEVLMEDFIEGFGVTQNKVAVSHRCAAAADQ